MKQINFGTASVLATVLILVFCAVGLAQQPESGSAAIYFGDGYLFVENGKDRSFTFEVRGKTIEPVSTGNNPTFKLDGRILQIVIVQNENYLGGAKEADEAKMLGLHQAWESGWLENDIYKAKLKLETESITVGARKMLFWGFKRPSLNDEYDRDYFLTTLMGTRMLGLSSPIKVGEAVSDYKKLFIDIFSTLKVSDKPFDIAKLSEEIRKGTYKGN